MTMEETEAGPSPSADARPRRSLVGKLLLLAPVAVFSALAVLLLVRLFSGDPSQVPSALIGQQVPAFAAPALPELTENGVPVAGFDQADLTDGDVTLVNFWASWCGPCRDEHPYLVALAEDGRFDVLGINYKDAPDNARRFLGRYGNPFDAVGTDRSGRTAIDWGVYGMPETFVVSGEGTILFKHIGPITAESLDQLLMPQIEAALAGDSADPAVGSGG